MRRLFATLERLESSLASVLVLGESGVGKDLVARAIHEASAAADGPFVAKNCAAMTRELALSELFGHRRGAFTGAFESRVGAFEAAARGTLFLDEIADLPREVQPMLLRALESGQVTPVGSNEPRSARVRLVAATNRGIRAHIRSGEFREDLFYRIAVVTLEIPPLRERPEDILPIAQLFATRAGLGALPEVVSRRLGRHTWPGNVRELRNVIEAYAALGTLPELEAAFDGEALDHAIERGIDLSRPLDEQRRAIFEQFTRAYLGRLLALTGGNQSEASRIARIERSQFRRLLSKHGFLPSDERRKPWS